jgi:hypothetical protein
MSKIMKLNDSAESTPPYISYHIIQIDSCSLISYPKEGLIHPHYFINPSNVFKGTGIMEGDLRGGGNNIHSIYLNWENKQSQMEKLRME